MTRPPEPRPAAAGAADAARESLLTEQKRRRWERAKNVVGLAILAAAFGWSVVHVTYQAFWKAGETSLTGDRRIIRFVHWQLEGGIVKAVDEACRLYEKIHPDVEVQQIEVPERAYTQWVRTQLVGRTAPDLIENRFEANWIVRYFVPVTERVDHPNPYNAREMDARLVRLLGGDPAQVPDLGVLEGVPWRKTYIDNMKGGWYWELQDYYAMPLSVFTVRIFANKNLLEAAAGDLLPRDPKTGQVRGPQDLETFFRVCDRIKAYGDKAGQKLVPIAGSDYVADIFRGRYYERCTWNLLAKGDLDGDSSIGNGERLLAVAQGDIDVVNDPDLAAGHKLLYRICQQFNPGFMNMKREDSVFMVAQGKAVMMATGSWEAGTMQQQVEGLFDILVFDFPMPRPGQPYYETIRHRITEAGTKSGFPMSLTKFSRHPDLAIDFMHFMSSRRVNEWLNNKFSWFPAVRGAVPAPVLEPFTPNVEGVYCVYWMDFGGDTKLRYDQQYQGFVGVSPPQDVPLAGWLDGHYKRFITRYMADYDKYVLQDFEKRWREAYTGTVQTEFQLAQARARVLRGGLTEQVRENYVALVLGQSRRIAERADDVRYFEAAKKIYAAKRAGGAE